MLVKGQAGRVWTIAGRTSNGEGYSATSVTLTGDWQTVGVVYRHSATDATPLTQMGLQFNAQRPAGYTSETLKVSGALIESLETQPADAFGVFFDGDTNPPVTYWAAAANASQSVNLESVPAGTTRETPPGSGLYAGDSTYVETPAGSGLYTTSDRPEDPAFSGLYDQDYVPPPPPTLTVYTDMTPCPRVVVNFSTFIEDTASVDLYRLGDGEPQLVPGAQDVQASETGGLVKTDYYPPFGIPITYRAQQFDAAGNSLGYTDSASAIVDVSFTVVTSPYDPMQSAVIDMDEEAGSALTNPTNAATHEFNGRRIVLIESQQLLAGVNMSFWTDTLPQYQKVLDVFRSSRNFVVIRTPPPMQVPRVFYVFGAPVRSETNLPGNIEEFLWDLKVDEVTPPSAVLLVAVITYGTYSAGLSTYGAFKSSYLTYREALLTPPAVN